MILRSIIGIPEEQNKRGQKNILKNNGQRFLKFWKNIDLPIPKAKQTYSETKETKTIQVISSSNCLKANIKTKILKSAGKNNISHTRTHDINGS